MTFIQTVSDDEATGAVAELYNANRDDAGHVANFIRVFSHHPELDGLWEKLLSAIRGRLDPRRYEIATVAAASEIGSSYCTLAHGSVLMNLGMEEDTLVGMVQGRAGEVLNAEEAAVFAYARKIAHAASTVTQDDVDGLKAHGLSDSEIFDIAAAAAIRCFIAKLVDAVGAQPDAKFHDLEPELGRVLSVGRAIEDAG